jgi:hypothetical protein
MDVIRVELKRNLRVCMAVDRIRWVVWLLVQGVIGHPSIQVCILRLTQ